MLLSIPDFIHLLNKKRYTYRLKINNEPLTGEWSNWLIHPCDSYLEVECQGPYAINKIEWIDINPVIKKKIGRLMPEETEDLTNALLAFLENAGINYSIIDKIIRLTL